MKPSIQGPLDELSRRISSLEAELAATKRLAKTLSNQLATLNYLNIGVTGTLTVTGDLAVSGSITGSGDVLFGRNQQLNGMFHAGGVNLATVIHWDGDGKQSTFLRGGYTAGSVYVGDLNTGGVYVGAAGNFTTIQGDQRVVGSLTGSGQALFRRASSGLGSLGYETIMCENNSDVVIGLRGPGTNEKSIYFTNTTQVADGGIVYDNPTMPRGFQFRTGGNNTRASIDSNGITSFLNSVAVTGTLTVTGSFVHQPSSGKLGFYGTAPAGIQTVTGSRGGNVALTGLLNALAALGLIINNTTA